MSHLKVITLHWGPSRLMLVWAACALSIGAIDVPAQEPSNLSLDAIMSLWTERESALRTLECTWLSKKFTRGDFAAAQGGRAQREKSVVPDIIRGAYGRFVFDKSGTSERIRLEFEDAAWSAGKRIFLGGKEVNVFDGSVERHFLPSPSAGFPVGSVRSTSLEWAGRDLKSVPLILATCPLHPVIGMGPSGKYRLTGVHAAVKERPVIVLGVDESEVWVDPAMACLPVRYLQRASGKNILLVELSYAHSEGAGWTPESWKISLFGGGAILESESATVTRFAVNEPVKDAEFQLDFPVGTYVLDSLAGQDYIVRPNHQRRLVLPGEYNGRNYHELLTTEPRSQGRSFWRVALVCLSVAVLLAAMAMIGFSKWRRGRRQ